MKQFVRNVSPPHKNLDFIHFSCYLFRIFLWHSRSNSDSVPSIVDFCYTVQLYGYLLLFVNRAEETSWKRLILHLMKSGLSLGCGGRSSDLSAFCLVCKVLGYSSVLKW
jgi:hypothetical protein